MATAFDCPSCGGPLSFDPKPGDETVICSYCHDTVIIPEDLRIPLPRIVQVVQPLPRQTNRTGCVVIGVIVALVIAVIVISAIGSGSDSSGDSALYDSGTSAANTRATEKVQVTLTAQAAFEVRATVDALQPLLKEEQSWPVVFNDKFVDNSHEWKNGDIRDSYITGNRNINDGIYAWNVTAVQSTSYFAFPTMDDQKDFYASVDIKYLSMPPDDPDADAGLVFRHDSTSQTWYYFSINDKGQYYFGWYNGKNWYTLINETDSSAILQGQTNRLTVGVWDTQFIFLINGKMVDHFNDDSLKTGTIGLGINLPKEGEKASLVFKNFTVSAPNR